MTELSIADVPVTERPSDDLIASIAVYNGVLQDQLGTDEFAVTATEALAPLHDQRHHLTRRLVARDGDRPVGTALFEHDRGASVAEVFVGVLPDDRQRGIGRRLAERITEIARQEGVNVLQAWYETADLDSRPRLTAPSGHGDVPAESPAAIFLRRAGFRLGQVEVISALDLPVPESVLNELAGGVRETSDYDLVSWVGAVPEEFVDDYARLRMVMSTAAPAGELTEEVSVWDGDRVRARDRRNAAAGYTTIDTAARHRSSGQLVAFTSFTYSSAADSRPVHQGYTLVEPEHRGHNLGLRIKINNLRLLAEQNHGARRVITGNAGENDAMLSINRALGFRPVYVGAQWEREIKPADIG